ncbi:unnamed protein product [Rodentolepis nana]|uniref:TRPM SLOG domain-containing protein n=1 Tax=Rodentolepis nana TaxID=102285 RepID=A0A0R3TSQ6_RODNA|nr:unnamed protein product [Rodentolepis nana]
MNGEFLLCQNDGKRSSTRTANIKLNKFILLNKNSEFAFLFEIGNDLVANLLFSCFRNLPRAKQPFYDVYVFVVGGGTYTEYHNLLQWSRAGASSIGGSGSGIGGSVTQGSSSSLNALGLSFPSSGSGSDLTSSGSSGIPGVGSTRRITYGGTEILTPKIFLEQLTQLGKET